MTLWTTQEHNVTGAEKIWDHCHGFVRVRHCRGQMWWLQMSCSTQQIRCSAWCNYITIIQSFSRRADTQSALRNHHNNCANLQLALKFLLSSCPPWRLNDTLPAHCNIQRMIRNAGPSSDRGRISPNGCLSFIISPNWACCMHAPCPGLSWYLVEWQIRVRGPESV